MTHTMRVDARTGDDVTFVCDECGRVIILDLNPEAVQPHLVLIRGDEMAGHRGSTVDGLELSVAVELEP
jgi:hypothetical protein